MLIAASPERREKPGDLDARVVGQYLHLSPNMVETIGKTEIRTAEDLVSYMVAFPSRFANLSGWSTIAVSLATERLKRSLERHISSALLNSLGHGK